jgi:caffeoyl-CoA O-methyltransferase
MLHENESEAAMKSDLGISPQIEAYVSRFGTREHPALKRCREETQANNPRAQMQIGEDQGAFMALMAKLIGAKRYLEIGTFTGYSALAVALALPADGQAVCLDISKEYTDLARGYWKEADMESKIDLRIGPALDAMDKMIAAGEAPFDFVFIDADKPNYDGYYERALKLTRKGGLIAVDNMLWSGAVADPSNKEESTIAIRALNQKIHADDRVDMALTTIADGIMLACKK